MPLIQGTIIHFSDGTTGIVGEKLGEGGQGEVYRLMHSGKPKVLKWYKNRPNGEFLKNLKTNVEERQCPSSSYLWPTAFTDTQLGSGYVMDLIKPGMEEFSKYLCTHCYFKNWNAIINACINLCVAFQKLHAKGLAYFDLNDGNFFFNPETGDLQIGDNDNVSAATKNVAHIRGKQGYIAPEIELGGTPDRQSDYFSLALILFRVMFVDHPLHGKKMEDCVCITPDIVRYLYGSHPTFIFDRTNHDNEANEEFSPNALERWNKVPEYIRAAFERVFSRTKVYNTPQDVDLNSRIMEWEWIRLLDRWRGQLSNCPNCGKKVAIEAKQNCKCTKCGQSLHLYWMRTNNKEFIPLVHGNKIFDSQIGIPNHFSIFAEIIASTKDKTVLGMKNMSPLDWLVTIGGHKKVIHPGSAFPLYDRASIKVGNTCELMIRYI